MIGSMISLDEVRASPVKQPSVRIYKDSLQAYESYVLSLRTGKLSGSAYRKQLAQCSELEKYTPSTSEFEKQAQVIALPGFSFEQATSFIGRLKFAAATVNSKLLFPRFGAYGYRVDLLLLATTALSEYSPWEKSLPFACEPMLGSDLRCELRPVVSSSTPGQSLGTAAVVKALKHGKILRFVYQTEASAPSHTRRVAVRSLTMSGDKLVYFTAEHGGKIRTYSMAKTSDVLVEEIAAKYLTPTLLIKIELSEVQQMFTVMKEA
jgi:hypothetical protein